MYSLNKTLIICGFVVLHVWLTYVNTRLLKAEKALAYAQGRDSVYQEFAELPASPSGTCYAKKGNC